MNSIIELVLKTVKSLDQPLKTKEFLEYLRDGNDYQQRLLLCLGIDIKANLLDLNIISEIFNSIDYDTCLKCNQVLDSYENAIIKLGVFVSQIHNKPKDKSIRLSRVMKSSVYSHYFYPKTIGIYDINPDWRNIKREIERGNLESIKMPNNALKPRRLVWCTPLNELEETIQTCNDTMLNPANEIVNRLGLCLNATSNSEYIYIEYDDNFNEPIFQPCNFSNSWVDETSLYLSCKTNDGFGRTRPRQGDDRIKQMKEAIHDSIDNPNNFLCSIKLLGNVTDYNINTVEFNNDAMKRYTI